MRGRIVGAVAALLAVTAALAGCGGGPGGEGGPGGAAPFALPVGEPAYDAADPTWAVDTLIRVGEIAITASPEPWSYVVTTSGVYYTARSVLWFTDGRGAPERVADIGSPNLVLSPDGRYLGLVDHVHGRTDRFGTTVAAPVVFDVATGAQVLRAPFEGSLDEQDLAVLYGEVPVELRGFAEGAAYVADPLREGEVTRLPLDGGPEEPLDATAVPPLRGPLGYETYLARVPGGGLEPDPLVTRAGFLGALSPDRRLVFRTQPPFPPVLYEARTGAVRRFAAGAARFFLGGWRDDDSFYGAAADRGGTLPAGRTVMVECRVSTLACRPLSGTLRLTGELSPDPEPTQLLFATGRPLSG